MKTESITYEFGGQSLCGYLAYDESLSGKRPGILVVHEAFGLGEHAKERARMIAGLGYVAFAADLMGNGQEFTDFNKAIETMMALRADPPTHRGRAKAGIAVLAGLPQVDSTRLGAIGFCFGGMTVLELAREGVDLKAVVSFHGALETNAPAQKGAIKASVLSCTGADDPMIGPASVQAFDNEMRQAQADYQIILYGNAVHSFTNKAADGSMNPAIHYEKRADERSWSAMKALFEEVFNKK